MDNSANNNKSKILIASWKKVFYYGLIEILNRRSDVEVVDFCHSGHEAILSATNKKPDLVFIDEGIRNCDFIELSHAIRRILPDVIIFVVTSSYPHPDVLTIFKADAQFYLDKDVTADPLNTLVDRISEGPSFENPGVFIHPALAEQLLQKATLPATEGEKDKNDNIFGLTKREAEILSLAVRDKSNKDIAHELFITPNTVKVHMRSIFEKLNIKDRHQLAPLLKELDLKKS
jgi:two-component system, NarL family, response regulator